MTVAEKKRSDETILRVCLVLRLFHRPFVFSCGLRVRDQWDPAVDAGVLTAPYHLLGSGC